MCNSVPFRKQNTSRYFAKIRKKCHLNFLFIFLCFFLAAST